MTVLWMVATLATLLIVLLLFLGGLAAQRRDDPATNEMILLGLVAGNITGLLSLGSGWLARRRRLVPVPAAISYGALIIALIPLLLLLLALLFGPRFA